MDEGAGQRGLLRHALRVVQDHLVGRFLQLQQIEQGRDAAADFGDAEAVQSPDQLDLLGGGEALVEAERLRDDADAALDLHRLRAHVEARDARRPLGRRQQADQHVDGGRFARAVRPQEAENHPARHAQVQVIHGGEFIEAPRQVLGLDGGGVSVQHC